MSQAYFVKLVPLLGEHYRIVMADNMGFGLNQRTEDVSDAVESPEKAEAWIVEWWHVTIEALELPPKFYVSGHSNGGC